MIFMSEASAMGARLLLKTVDKTTLMPLCPLSNHASIDLRL